MAAALNQAWRGSGNDGFPIKADDLAGIWLRASGKCAYCAIDVELMTASFDHVEPLSKGGYHGVGNLRLSCITCQRSKYTKTPEEYAKWKELRVRCRICGKDFKPRWADYIRGYGQYHSRSCAGKAAHQ